MNDDVTNADIHALGDTIPAAAVTAAHDAPAPVHATGAEIATFMNSVGNRVSQIEAVLGVAAPLLSGVVSAVDPNAAPVLARLEAIETAVEGVLSALAEAFGNKSPSSLPAPGTATANAPAVIGAVRS